MHARQWRQPPARQQGGNVKARLLLWVPNIRWSQPFIVPLQAKCIKHSAMAGPYVLAQRS